jgi:hypothetical protein
LSILTKRSNRLLRPDYEIHHAFRIPDRLSLSFALSHGAIGKEKDEDTDESASEVTIEKTVEFKIK